MVFAATRVHFCVICALDAHLSRHEAASGGESTAFIQSFEQVLAK
jgi:hypothetical protein